MKSLLIVNFGGPRNLEEVAPFLISLLTDQDVVTTPFPKLIHYLLFRKIAKKRALKVCKDYEAIGGRSPIFEDTEALAAELKNRLKCSVVTFHRYLPSTHKESLKKIIELDGEKIRVFPLFPQFTYATTGSAARFLQQKLPKKISQKLDWVKSYAKHPSFVASHQKSIKHFLKSHDLKEEECVLIFSAHGVPISFVEKGDPYENDCRASFEAVMEGFPKTKGILSYQSQYGKSEWLRPYTRDICKDPTLWNGKTVLFIPISFTSDHIETLFEIEEEYMNVIRKSGTAVYRIPALNLLNDWIEAIIKIIFENSHSLTTDLIKPHS